MKVCLTVLMGLPGSGKTTFAQTLRKDFKSYDGRYFNFIHVCYDELLPSINYEHLQDGETKWKEHRNGVLNQIDLLLSSLGNDNFESCPKQFRAQLDVNYPDSVVVVLIDDNMYFRSMRYALFRKAKQYNISFCQVYLKCSVQESNQRNLLRGSAEVIPLDVICQMNGKIESPKFTNKWEKHSLIYEACDENHKLYSEYLNMLNIALENPERMENEGDLVEKEKDVLICMTNVLHQCDIAIRQIINEKIQQHRSQNGTVKALKDFSAQLSIQKGKVLSEIRSGAIEVPDTALAEIRENNSPDKKFLKLFLEDVLVTTF